MTKINKPDYSLWLMPERTGPCARRLQQHINSWAAHLGGPTFPPHVTLVPTMGRNGTQALCTAKEIFNHLSSGLIQPPRFLHPRDVTVGKLTHQCVYLVFGHSPLLVALNRYVLRAFTGIPQQASSYMPHLSLIYGDHRMEDRHQARCDLRSLIELQLPLARLALWRIFADEGRWQCVWSAALPRTRKGTRA